MSEEQSKPQWLAKGENFVHGQLRPAIEAAGLPWVEPSFSDPEQDGCWSADWTGPQGRGILGGGDDGEGGWFIVHTTRDAPGPAFARSVDEFAELYRRWFDERSGP